MGVLATADSKQDDSADVEDDVEDECVGLLFDTGLNSTAGGESVGSLGLSANTETLEAVESDSAMGRLQASKRIFTGSGLG